MQKYLIIMSLIFLFASCGRVGSSGNGIETSGSKTSSNKLTIAKKSRFIKSDISTNSGHYSLLFNYDEGNNRDLEGELFENGSKDTSESKVQINSRENSVTNNILLLLDYSGSIVNNEDILNELKNSTKTFIENINEDRVKIAIYYFTDEKNITPIIEEPLSKEELDKALSNLDDPIRTGVISTNLYGAVIEATNIACDWVGGCEDKEIPEENNDFASIVVLTDGHDRAGRQKKETMTDLLKKQKEFITYQAIGIGENIDRDMIETISQLGGIYVEEFDVENIKKAFEDLVLWANSFYDIKYCLSRKKGDVDIEIKIFDSNSSIGFIKEKNVESEDASCDL